MAKITGKFAKNNLNYELYINYSYTQNINSNATTITATMYIKKLRSYGNTYANSVPYSLSIGGSTIKSGNMSYDSRNMSVGTVTKICDGSKTINNNADGSLKSAISGVFDLSNFNPGKGTVSQTVTFPTIPRATAPTISGTKKFGSAITINHTGAINSFTHTIKYTVGSSSGTIATKTSSNSTSWTIPKSLQSELPNATTGTVTITCITYNGSTEVGTKSTSFNATISDDCVPSISSASFADAMTKPSSLSGYYQNFSKVKTTVSASGIYGSNISSYKVKVGSLNEVNSSSNVVTSGTLSTSGAYNIVVTVVDSRGKSASKTFSSAINVTAYTPPSISLFTCKRMKLEDGVESESNLGTIGYITLNGTIQASMPTKTRQLKYKPTTGSVWTTVNLSNQNYTNYKFSTTLSPSNAYNLKLVLKDDLTTVEKDITMSNIFPLLSLNAQGNGVAFGKESTTQNIVEFDMPVKTNKDINASKVNASKLEINDEAIINSNLNVKALTYSEEYYVRASSGGQFCNLGGFGGDGVYGSTQGVAYLGNTILVYGSYTFTNITTNTVMTTKINFRVPFKVAPFISLTFNSGAPHLLDAGATAIGNTSFDLNFIRNGTADTTIFWCAIGQRGV